MSNGPELSGRRGCTAPLAEGLVGQHSHRLMTACLLPRQGSGQVQTDRVNLSTGSFVNAVESDLYDSGEFIKASVKHGESPQLIFSYTKASRSVGVCVL